MSGRHREEGLEPPLEDPAMKPEAPPRSIDEYIAGFPAGVQEVLREIRRTIREAAPELEEAIAYRIPTFRLDGKNLIHFAGYAKHVGVYPAPRGSAEFRDELAAYAGGKGTLQLPLGQPMPLDLIRRIVEFRVRERRGDRP
jgi:uncharacterized protein YdhG (YjbR/CyaY superfamily)